MLDLTDAELVAAVRHGESEPFDVLFRRHYAEACEYASRFASPDVAPHRVTLAFSRVYRALLTGRDPGGDFQSILHAAVRSAHADVVRRDGREVVVDDSGIELNPDDEVDDVAILRAFGRLRPQWRTVLWHTVVLEESDEQVAELLGSTPKDVAALWLRAREGLRRACLDEGLPAPDDLGAVLTPSALVQAPGLLARSAPPRTALAGLVTRVVDARRAVVGVAAVAVVATLAVLAGMALTADSDPEPPAADAAFPSTGPDSSSAPLPSSGQSRERGHTLKRLEKPETSATTSFPTPSETVTPTTPVDEPPSEDPEPTEEPPTPPSPKLAQQAATSYGSGVLRFARVTFTVTPLDAEQVVVSASNARMMSVGGAGVSCASRSMSGGNGVVTCSVVTSQNAPFSLTVNVTYADPARAVSGSVALTGGAAAVSDGFTVEPG